MTMLVEEMFYFCWSLFLVSEPERSQTRGRARVALAAQCLEYTVRLKVTGAEPAWGNVTGLPGCNVASASDYSQYHSGLFQNHPRIQNTATQQSSIGFHDITTMKFLQLHCFTNCNGNVSTLVTSQP